MSTQTETVDPTKAKPRWYTDGVAFAFIAAAIVTSILSDAWPIFYWFAPVFVLLYLDRLPKLIGFLIFFVTSVPIFLYQTDGVIPVPEEERVVMAVIFGILGFLPFLLQLLVKKRLPSILVPLIYPAATVTLEFVGSSGPFGTFGSLAYTQFGFSPLMQVASVTGIWGITFLVSWVASAIWWWITNNKSSKPNLAMGSLILTLVLVLLFAGWRISTFNPSEPGTQFAKVGCVAAPDGPTPLDAVHDWIDASKADPELPTTDQRFVDCEAAVMEQLNYLTLKTAELADLDAKLIVWSEAALVTLPEFEDEIIQACSRLAKEHETNIVVALAVYIPEVENKTFENKSVFIHKTGVPAGEYFKTKLVPGEPCIPGDGSIAYFDTERFGRVAPIICFDADFPEFVRKTSANPRKTPRTADVLVVSANDWNEIATMHLQMCATRAIENGLWTIRSTSNGISAIIDPLGRVIAQTNSFDSDQAPVVVPFGNKRLPTIYSIVGDSFAVACVVGLLLLLAFAWLTKVLDKRKEKSAKTLSQPS